MIQMVIEIDIVYYFHCDALIIYIYIYSICIGYILFVFFFCFCVNPIGCSKR